MLRRIDIFVNIIRQCEVISIKWKMNENFSKIDDFVVEKANAIRR